MADDLGAWMDACERVYLLGATLEFWRAEARLTATERLMSGTTTALSMFGGAGDAVRAEASSHGSATSRGTPRSVFERSWLSGREPLRSPR